MRMFYKLITLSQRQHVDNKKKNSISMMIEGVEDQLPHILNSYFMYFP